jgi:hypothetical protein
MARSAKNTERALVTTTDDTKRIELGELRAFALRINEPFSLNLFGVLGSAHR